MKKKEIENCLNCGTQLQATDKFCPECGEKKTDLNLTFTHFFHDFLSNNFNLDSKIFLTLRLLIFSPGKLSHEFLEGKRTKYVTPVRLYLIISLVYFTVLSFTNNSLKLKDKDSNNFVFNLDVNESDSLNILDGNDSIIQSDTIGTDSFEKFLVTKLKVIQTRQGMDEFNRLLRSYVSIGMFLLIPLTALILFFLFYKSSFYFQHLVFIIHLQSIIFIVFTFFNLLSLLANWDIFAIINLLLFIFLLLIWIKKFYALKWGKAIWKSLLFLFLYGIAFIFFLAAVAGISFYNL